MYVNYWVVADEDVATVTELDGALRAMGALFLRFGSAFFVALERELACETIFEALQEAGFAGTLAVLREGDAYSNHSGVVDWWRSQAAGAAS